MRKRKHYGEHHEKIKEIRQDEIIYRQHRYAKEAFPTLITVILFSAVTAGLQELFLFGGLSNFLSLMLATTISATSSYLVYAGIKTWAASEGKQHLTLKQIHRENNKNLEEEISPQYKDCEDVYKLDDEDKDVKSSTKPQKKFTQTYNKSAKPSIER